MFFTNPADRPIGYWPNKDSEGGGRYYIDGVLPPSGHLGDELYFFNTTSRQLAFNTAKNMSVTQVVLPQLSQLVVMTAVTNTHFDGLAFRHVVWECGTDDVCDHQSTSWQTTGAVNAINCTHVTMNHVEVGGSGTYGVWVQGAASASITVSNSTFHDLGSGAVRVGSNIPFGPRDVLVTDNRMHRGGLTFPSGTPVLVQKGHDIVVQHNEISHFSYKISTI